MRISFLAVDFQLFANYIVIYNFRCTITDIVHFLNPQHHIGCFKFLSYIFSFGEVFYQLEEHFLRLTVNVGKVAVQPAAGEQGDIGCPAMLLQIAPVALSPHADGLLLHLVCLCNQIIDLPTAKNLPQETKILQLRAQARLRGQERICPAP